MGTAGALPAQPAADGNSTPKRQSTEGLVGGVRGDDGTGVIARNDQRSSDLPAGSCVVASDNPKGSQAGFSWSTLEPSANSPSKTLWGLSVAFDNSQDRTFADWSFTNSGLLGAVLDPGEVPSMEAGQTFVDESVTHRADESIVIDGFRQQRNLNLYAELTAEEVKQFGSATADNPVRYAWQGNYKVDNPSGLKATQGSSLTFSATVNPWPSENIECNPITVSWEKISKHVIVTDEETKVGHINIPAVQNGGTDDSLSRMLVEAYDGNGDFLGTSDAKTSGGEQRLRIDENGDIYFTWPKYRDPENADKSTEQQKLAAQQNINFSVMAKPRTVDQLQAAAENNNGGEGKAFDSSNSLSRYNKPNVIENRALSLDDTGDHDPQYDMRQKTIISGVDSVTGPLAEGRQKVTFKQVPDKIADLIKKKGEDGYDATVRLNEDYVFDGWDAEMNPDTHDVTITAPEHPHPGTFAQARVIITYSNGSKDEIPLLAAVQENDTQTTDVSYPVKRAPQTVEMQAEPQLTRIFKKNQPVRKPRFYELRKGWTPPKGWTVEIDKWSGKVTAKSDATIPDNTVLEVPVVATYWDQTTDEATAKFQVASSVKVPGYDATSGKAGDEVRLPAKLPKIGLGGNEDDEKPNRYTFENGDTTFKPDAADPNYQWEFTIDPNTGEITARIPEGALPGAYYSIPVKAHYASGAPSQNTTATVTVVGAGDGVDVAHYLAQSTRAGVPVDSKINTQLSDPKLATYELGKVPEGWTATIAEDGTVTATPDENQKPGTEIEIPVSITYPGGGKGTTTAKFIVVGNDAQRNDPLYPTETVVRGETAKNRLNPDSIDTDRVEKFEIITDPNAPGYIKPPANLDLKNVTIDNEGTVSTPVPRNTLPGSSADIPVKVTYKDGSVDYTLATVVVKGQRSQVYEPQYKQKVTKPGEGIESNPIEGTGVAERDLGKTGFTVPTEVEGWKVQVDQKTGKVTATPPTTARSGDAIEVPVTIEYEDGSKDTVFAPFLVRAKDNEFHEPSYSVESTKPGDSIKHTISNAPDGAKFDVPQEEEGWKYTVDAAGNVTATAPKNAKPGDKKTTNVTVTYPDGSTDSVPVTTVVSLTNSYEAEPFYPAEKSYPGETATSPLNVRKAEGIDLATDNPFAIIANGSFKPSGQNNDDGNPIYSVSTSNGTWKVSLDKDGNVKAEIPATAKPGDNVQVPVRVTYADGSTDETTASITVVDNPTRPIPFEVEYKDDDTIPAGKYEVETKGKPGSEKQKKDGTWERVEAPTNEVVRVGIKPAKSAKDVTWKVPIPYSTEVRENPTLAPGETKVVQEGENGEKTFTAKFTSEGDKAEVVEEETTKEPVKRIVEYGPGLGATELVTKTEKPVPFKTEVTADPNLEVGTKVVDQKGELGTDVVTSTQKLEDGKPSGNPTVTTERTKEPTTEKIRVGTKTTGTTTETVKSEVPFGVKVEFDPNLPAGTSETVTEGKPGEKTVTIKRDIVNSKPGEPKITEEITKQPVDQVIKVGTKPSEANEKVTWTAQVPFEVETRPNPELKPGEIKVVQKGVPGEKTYTADFTAKGDQATVKPEEKQTKDPVNEIIEYGPTIDDQTLTSTTTRPIQFKTKIIFDPELPAGEQTDTQGENGEETVTSTQEIKDGKPFGDPKITTEVTKTPVDAVIRVGTKVAGDVVAEFDAPVPYPTKFEYDPELPAGETKVTQEGKNGEKTVTVTQPVVNGKPDGKPTVSEKVTTEPTPKIVKVGTKQATATDSVEWTEPIPFSTTLRPNPDLAPGETKVVQEGKNGKVTYKATFTGTNGEAKVEETKDRTEPVEEIVEYGPRVEDQSVVTTVKRQIPFETTIIADSTLEAGKQIVQTQGVIGEETVTSTQKIVDGKPSGDPVVTTTRTKEKQDAVIRVGTKTTGEITKSVTTAIPFGVKVEFDPSMPAGTSMTIVGGQPGEKTITVKQKVTDSQPDGVATVEEKVTKEPIDQVIKVGTKPSEANEKVTWTAQVPFEVETRPNPQLKPGEMKVVQKGVPGEKVYTADFTAKGDQASVKPEEKQTKDPVKEIIEYGPAAKDTTVVTKLDKPVPFETEIVFDDTLPAGEQRTDQHGETGTEVVTSTQKIVDGKPSGEPTVTTERTKEPKKAIIRVGTKTAGETKNSTEVEMPFPVRVVYDPSLKPGESKVSQEGKPGKKKVTITQPVENGKPVGKATVTEEVVEKPTEQIVTVGTKPAAASNTVTWTAPLPYDTVVRPNSDLKPGEFKTVQEGEYGEKKFTADFSSADDTSKVNAKEEVTKKPKQQIIEYGPTSGDQTLTGKTAREVDFETEFVFDDTLPAGEQKVDQQGEKGEEEITVTQEIKDGKPVGEPKISTNQTKAPKKAIIRVGTKTEGTDGTHKTEYEVDVPFETEIQFDDTMEAGKQETVQEGKLGKDKVTTTQTIENSKVTDTKTDIKRVTDPVKKIIKVGTKGKPASTTVEWTETTPFEVEVRVNPDLKPGETKIVQGGKPGEVKHTVTVNANNGEISKDESTEEITKPTKQIIEVGPAKANKTGLTDKHTEKIPFETVIEYDPSLEAGKVVEDQAGAFGEKEVSKTWKLEDGKPVGDPETSEKVLKKPQPRKVRVGTKPAATTGEVTKVLETEVPFKVKVIYDPTIPAGETKVDTEGKPGKKEVTITQKVTNSNPDGEATVTEKVIEEPVDHVIRVGTKTAAAEENVEWKESIPYPTTVRTNPTLAPGEVKVVQEGKNGEVKYSAKFTAVNGETAIEQSQDRTEPVERIIEVGPKLPPQEWKHKTTARLPFETVVVIDNNLEAGKKVIDQEGVEGEESITITQKMVDGKPVGDAVETREQTKAPVKQIIRVGGKSTCDCTPKPDPTPEPSPMPTPSPSPTQPPSRTPNPDGQGSPSVHPTPKPGMPSTGVAGMADTLVTTCLTAMMCLGIAVAAVLRRKNRS